MRYLFVCWIALTACTSTIAQIRSQIHHVSNDGYKHDKSRAIVDKTLTLSQWAGNILAVLIIMCGMAPIMGMGATLGPNDDAANSKASYMHVILGRYTDK